MKAKVRWTDKETGMIRGGTLTARSSRLNGRAHLYFDSRIPVPRWILDWEIARPGRRSTANREQPQSKGT